MAGPVVLARCSRRRNRDSGDYAVVLGPRVCASNDRNAVSDDAAVLVACAERVLVRTEDPE
jgi:hypothetical protein